jgi:hypothetical protein
LTALAHGYLAAVFSFPSSFFLFSFSQFYSQLVPPYSAFFWLLSGSARFRRLAGGYGWTMSRTPLDSFAQSKPYITQPQIMSARFAFVYVLVCALGLLIFRRKT